MDSASVPQTRQGPKTSKLFTDRVLLGSKLVISIRSLAGSVLSQELIRDWWTLAWLLTLCDRKVLLLPPWWKREDFSGAFVEASQCQRDPSSEQVNRWSGLDGWKWTSHISASWAFSNDTGMVPCLTSQILNIPSWPPVATTCCWSGCLSTQWSGTRSPVSDNIWQGSLPCCLKSHIFNCPIEFTVTISGVRRKVTAWSVLLSALSASFKNVLTSSF